MHFITGHTQYLDKDQDAQRTILLYIYAASETNGQILSLGQFKRDLHQGGFSYQLSKVHKPITSLSWGHCSSYIDPGFFQDIIHTEQKACRLSLNFIKRIQTEKGMLGDLIEYPDLILQA